MQKRRNFIANALELRLFCINPSIYVYAFYINTPPPEDDVEVVEIISHGRLGAVYPTL